jgi:hypothetical protein
MLAVGVVVALGSIALLVTMIAVDEFLPLTATAAVLSAIGGVCIIGSSTLVLRKVLSPPPPSGSIH